MLGYEELSELTGRSHLNLFAIQEVLRFGFSLVEVPAGDGIGEPLYSETDVTAPDPCRGSPGSPGRGHSGARNSATTTGVQTAASSTRPTGPAGQPAPGPLGGWRVEW
jgi:hypothetical protein